MVLKQSRAHLGPPDDILTTLDGRRPLIEDDLENEDDLKNEDDFTIKMTSKTKTTSKMKTTSK